MKGLLALLLLTSGWAGEGRFKLSAPVGWSQTLLGPEELGAGASGAVYKSSAAARIIVVFYAAGNPHFKDAADYLARQTAALPVTPAGEKTGPVETGKLGSLPAKRFMRGKRDGKEWVTAADAPGGFYAVTCSAPAAGWKRLEPRFKAALASFSVK